MSVLSREQTVTTSLHQSSCADFLALRALTRTAVGKGGGKDTESEVTTRAWHEGPQKQRIMYIFYVVIDEDDN